MSVLKRVSADVECSLFWKCGEADLVWLLLVFAKQRMRHRDFDLTVNGSIQQPCFQWAR